MEGVVGRAGARSLVTISTHTPHLPPRMWERRLVRRKGRCAGQKAVERPCGTAVALSGPSAPLCPQLSLTDPFPPLTHHNHMLKARETLQKRSRRHFGKTSPGVIDTGWIPDSAWLGELDGRLISLILCSPICKVGVSTGPTSTGLCEA